MQAGMFWLNYTDVYNKNMKVLFAKNFVDIELSQPNSDHSWG